MGELAPPSADSVPLSEWQGLRGEELAAAWRVPAVHLYAELGSTNDTARDLAIHGAASGTVVLAEAQKTGRGRAGRSWVSPPGVGLWVSMIGRPHSDGLEPLSVRVGLALAGALDVWAGGGKTRVKWPNDLLLQGRKVGGILCEAAWSGGTLDHVVVGVGLNLLHAESDFPPELRASATSLAMEAAGPVSRFEVASRVVAAVEEGLREPALGPDLRPALEARDALRGRTVEVREPETARLVASGTAAGIDPRGRLLLRTASGERAIHSGTVRLLDEGG